MSTAQNGAGRTAEIVRTRERIGTGVLAFMAAWTVYIFGLVPLALELFESIDSELWKIVAAMAAVAVGVLTVANFRALWAMVWPTARKVINYATPVLPEAVTLERIKQLQEKLHAVEKKLGDVGALRMNHEAVVAQFTREEQAILAEAKNPKSGLDDATLGRKLNRAQEALRLRQEQLDAVRADEEALLDAREVCDLCVQRLGAALERYRSSVEIAKTVTGVRAVVGAEGQSDADALTQAEQACMSELAEVDALMANLDSALYDRKLGDRVAALHIAELRQGLKGSTNVRVEAEGESQGESSTTSGDDAVPAQREERRRGRRGR